MATNIKLRDDDETRALAAREEARLGFEMSLLELLGDTGDMGTEKGAQAFCRAVKNDSLGIDFDPGVEEDLDERFGPDYDTQLNMVRMRALSRSLGVSLVGKNDSKDDMVGLSKYLADLGDYRVLAPAEQIELSRLVRAGSEKARNLMMEHNLRLVPTLAAPYKNRGLPWDDLIQEGNLGLYEAVSRFDPERGLRFSSYAGYWIRSYICRALSKERDGGISSPLMSERLRKVRQIAQIMATELGRRPTLPEVAERMGLDASAVDECRVRGAVQLLSFDDNGKQSDDENSKTLKDFVVDGSQPQVETLVGRSLLRDDVREVLSVLQPRKRRVLQLRYGLIDGTPRSYDAIGQAFGVRRQRVHQLDGEALQEIKDEIAARGLEVFLEPDPEVEGVDRVGLSTNYRSADRFLSDIGIDPGAPAETAEEVVEP